MKDKELQHHESAKGSEHQETNIEPNQDDIRPCTTKPAPGQAPDLIILNEVQAQMHNDGDDMH